MTPIPGAEKQAAVHEQQDSESVPSSLGCHGPGHEDRPVDNDGGVAEIRRRYTFLRLLSKIENRVDGTAEFEAMGVERVPEDKRRPPQILNG
ncbi:hypothetical protein K4F52_002246 [Lecanicillium sp. MT-2017a]|nr:hypothetical protein K4F52_002246 [Lecanicillium sp. MT-2017a]